MPHLINHKSLAYIVNGQQELLMRQSHLSSCWTVREGQVISSSSYLPLNDTSLGRLSTERRDRRSNKYVLLFRVSPLRWNARQEKSFFILELLWASTMSIKFLWFTTLPPPSNQDGQSRYFFCLRYPPPQHASLSYLCLLPKSNLQDRHHYVTQKWPRK